jgi:Fic family protein
MLHLAEQQDFCTKAQLIALQNRIVDSRFADRGYRSSQNYVGETVAWQRPQIHFVSPKPEDLSDLMEGMEDAHGRMNECNISPVIHAAAISYGFVFLHPFEDGNGRIHRFLIHNILARRGFTPERLIFPVSAVMLKHPADYDASLEAFSRPLLSLVDYSLDEEGRMTVRNDTAKWYRYIDMTVQAEALFHFIAQTIDTELPDELTFLRNYDRSRESIRAIVDMPDRMIDLFIRLCLQNNGSISAAKRKKHFESLSDKEIAGMEELVRAACGNRKLMDE